MRTIFSESVSSEISKLRICCLERFFTQSEIFIEVGAQNPSLLRNEVVSIEKSGINLFWYLQGVVNIICELFFEGKSNTEEFVLQQKNVQQNKKIKYIFFILRQITLKN